MSTTTSGVLPLCSERRSSSPTGLTSHISSRAPGSYRTNRIKQEAIEIRHWESGEVLVRRQARSLEKHRFDGMDLRGADFAGWFLAGTSFYMCNLSGARFGTAMLIGATFRGSILADTDFDGADLTGADLTDSKMHGTTFRSATACDGQFRYAELKHADLSDADLQRCDFSMARVHADLSAANLADADMRSADLRKAILKDANLQGTKLTNAIFQTSQRLAVHGQQPAPRQAPPTPQKRAWWDYWKRSKNSGLL